ncbi:MAG: hypothetical protein R3E10_18220 [Gemmatimonadota bacterium]
MVRPRPRSLLALGAFLPLAASAPLGAQRPGRFAGPERLVVGLEYAVLDNARLVRSMAATFAETGLPGMKHYVEAVSWGEMQKGPDRPIDFRTMDLFVREYQAQGFTELTLSLKPHSPWGSRDVSRLRSTNASPKPEYREHFRAWVHDVVERYDGDGQRDMPGLRWPVRFVEIGNEFSSYEPEPVEEYLETLAIAYQAAHAAFADVRVGHAAFLITPVDLAHRDPDGYAQVWEETRRVDTHHGLDDLRAVLDRPDLFDFVNLHNLGSPYEIEHMMRWVHYEMDLRGWVKPVVISDTTPTSYIAWGPATTCEGPNLGLITSPATEADRCRIAAFFRRLVDRDPEALAWARGFVAADHVQRAIIAAEQGVRLINLAFVDDLGFATFKAFQAGAGLAAWGGALRISHFTGRVQERYPAYYALGQLMAVLGDYRSVERVDGAAAAARVYRVDGEAGPVWVAWLEPGRALLPEDDAPSEVVRLQIDAPEVQIEATITRLGQSEPQISTKATQGGWIEMVLTPTPVFLRPVNRE